MMAPDKQALKLASKALVRAAGGVEAAAENARPSKTLMGDYGSPHSDCFMPVDVVADLEAITHGTAGFPIVTRLLATRAGCALVELPAPAALDGDWFGVIGRLSSEIADITTRICTAATDGRICAGDVRQQRLVEECDDAIALLVNLRARFERIETSGTG